MRRSVIILNVLNYNSWCSGGYGCRCSGGCWCSGGRRLPLRPGFGLLILLNCTFKKMIIIGTFATTAHSLSLSASLPSPRLLLNRP